MTRRATGDGPSDLPPDLLETASQTAGPYLHIGCFPRASGLLASNVPELGSRVAESGVGGTPITLTGRVFDGAGEALRDAMIELWQADGRGRCAGDDEPPEAGFHGWARRATDPEDGRWRCETIRPGPRALPDGRVQAPHVALWIVARGINLGLHTRLYFAGEAANDSDPLLTSIRPASRARTLLAVPTAAGWELDIHLQGERETVFLDV